MPTRTSKLAATTKLALVARSWWSLLHVVVGLRRHGLPAVVHRIAKAPQGTRLRLTPQRLGRAVHRALNVGPAHPRCLHTALVLLRLLTQQGESPELVIGLPPTATSKDAHAWIELDRVDVGPPPGRSGHVELARFSASAEAQPGPSPRYRRSRSWS